MLETRKLALLVYGSTLDKLFYAFILVSTVISMDFEAHLYLTFWGLMMLKRSEMEKAGLPATYKHMEGEIRARERPFHPFPRLPRADGRGGRGAWP